MPKPARPVDVVNQAAKNGVGTARFRISREQAQQLREEEARGGSDAGLRFLLKLLAGNTKVHRKPERGH